MAPSHRVQEARPDRDRPKTTSVYPWLTQKSRLVLPASSLDKSLADSQSRHVTTEKGERSTGTCHQPERERVCL